MTHQDDNPAVGFYLNRGWRTITLNVCDAARSASFHQDLFGCQVERQDGDLIWLSTNADEKSSVLLLLHAWPNPEPTTYGISFEFEVPSVDGAVQAAQALGAEVTRDPIRMDYGKREATILDPDGYPIWLVQPLH